MILYKSLYESNSLITSENTFNYNTGDYLKYFFICSKDNPVHMLDSNGKFIYSYLTKNHVDEIINPISIKIDQYGLNFFSGFTKFFNIFDLNTDKLIQKVELKDKNYHIEKSKISCFDFNRFNDFYLVGTYSGKIYLMDYLTNKTFYSIDENHLNGVNILKFFNKPENNLYFISGGRKDSKILLWDARNLSAPIFSFFRENPTNQKLNFEIDKNDEYIYVANNDGSVIVYDVKNLTTASYFYASNFNTEKEAISCLDFNYECKYLVTANGSRHLSAETIDKRNESGNQIDLYDEEGVNDYNSDRGLKFWDFKQMYKNRNNYNNHNAHNSIENIL